MDEKDSIENHINLPCISPAQKAGRSYPLPPVFPPPESGKSTSGQVGFGFAAGAWGTGALSWLSARLAFSSVVWWDKRE